MCRSGSVVQHVEGQAPIENRICLTRSIDRDFHCVEVVHNGVMSCTCTRSLHNVVITNLKVSSSTMFEAHAVRSDGIALTLIGLASYTHTCDQ